MPNLRNSTCHLDVSKADLLDLTGLIYDAAMDPALWPAFLERYASTIGATGTNTQAQNTETSDLYYISAAGIADDALADYGCHWAEKDVWVPAGLHLPSGAAVTGPMLVPEEILERSDFYNDFLNPIDIHHLCTLVVSNDRSDFAITSAFRPKHKDDFGETELSIVRMLWPHLKRAVEIRRRFVIQEYANSSLVEALNQRPVGVVLLDAFGAITFSNQVSLDIFDAKDGLRITRKNGISAERSDETEKLQALIRSRNGTGIEDARLDGNVVAVSRPSGRRDYEVLVAPANALNVDGRPTSPKVILFITDPEREIETPTSLLRSIHGLSPAEARFAADFARRASLKESSEALGITEGTARQYMKTIFQKTDTKGQVELIKVLLTHLKLYQK